MKNQNKTTLHSGANILGWIMEEDVEILSKEELKGIIDNIRYDYSDELHEAFEIARGRVGTQGESIKAEIDVTTGDIYITHCKHASSNEFDLDKYLLLFTIKISDEARYNIDNYIYVLEYGCEKEVVDFYKENLQKELKMNKYADMGIERDIFEHTIEHFNLNEDELIKEYCLSIEEDVLNEATKGYAIDERIKELYSNEVEK